MLPLAPGRFSTTTDCPSRAASGSATTRALLSATPPGANGTMMRSGRAGQSCAGSVALNRIPTSNARTLFMKVELRYAPLPFIGAIAVHYWFVVYDDAGECHRWEVWQTKNAGGTSYDHVHCDLKTPEDGVGGGPSRLAATWTGEEAARDRKSVV